jgi:hypothetical protein
VCAVIGLSALLHERAPLVRLYVKPTAGLCLMNPRATGRTAKHSAKRPRIPTCTARAWDALSTSATRRSMTPSAALRTACASAPNAYAVA